MQVSANKFRHPSSHQLGLRSVLLLILFVVSLYEFKSMGLVGMGMVCAIPVAVIVVYIAFRWKMSTFWMLFVLNYFLMFLERYGYIPMPTSLPNELFEIVLLCIAIIFMTFLRKIKIFLIFSTISLFLCDNIYVP